MQSQLIVLVLCFGVVAITARTQIYRQRWGIPEQYDCPYGICNSPKRRVVKSDNCNYGMCETVHNYPEEEMINFIKKQASLHSYFGTVVQPDTEATFNNRFGFDDGEPFCISRTVTMFPKKMKDVDNIERIIVNVGNYTQALKFETCETKYGNQCYANSLFDHETTCVQKYNEVKLVVYNLDDNDAYKVFKIPSTCLCVYNRNKQLH